jgi:hypothetical protein
LLASRDFGERTWQRVLKNDPDIVKRYMLDIEQMHNQLLALPYIVVIDVPTRHVLGGLAMMKTYGLFPRDAIHVSITSLVFLLIKLFFLKEKFGYETFWNHQSYYDQSRLRSNS